jgi:cell division protein ZapA (FtsZ GTPase activity inhibitor)
MKNDLHIELLGTSFSISADEEPAYLENVLNSYRLAVGNIRESTGLQDPLKIAILTGYLLCDEVQRMHKKEAAIQETEAREEQDAMQITLDLISRIDRILEQGLTAR